MSTGEQNVNRPAILLAGPHQERRGKPSGHGRFIYDCDVWIYRMEIDREKVRIEVWQDPLTDWTLSTWCADVIEAGLPDGSEALTTVRWQTSRHAALFQAASAAVTLLTGALFVPPVPPS